MLQFNRENRSDTKKNEIIMIFEEKSICFKKINYKWEKIVVRIEKYDEWAFNEFNF